MEQRADVLQSETISTRAGHSPIRQSVYYTL